MTLSASSHSLILNRIRLHHRRSVNTKVDYRIYFDDGGLQLYETKRANTWVFLGKPGSNDASYKGIEGIGHRRRARDATIEQGANHDWVISIALDKFSANLESMWVELTEMLWSELKSMSSAIGISGPTGTRSVA